MAVQNLSENEIRVLRALPEEPESDVAIGVFDVDALDADDVAQSTGLKSDDVKPLLTSLRPAGFVTLHPEVVGEPDRYYRTQKARPFC